MTEHEDQEFAKRIAERLREAEPIDPGFEARLLGAVRAAADRGDVPWMQRARTRRSLGWLVAPRTFTIRPVGALALAAGFAGLVAMSTLAVVTDQREALSARAELVHFAIVAPTANSVSLVGDFNGWDAKTIPMTKGAIDGLWLVSVPLGAGSYQYAFVIDGTTWTADPAAPITLEDEFGTPSSILRIEGART